MAEYNLLFNVGARHVWKRKEYPFGRKAKLNKGGIAVIPRKLLMDVLAILDFIGNVIWRQHFNRSTLEDVGKMHRLPIWSRRRF